MEEGLFAKLIFILDVSICVIRRNSCDNFSSSTKCMHAYMFLVLRPFPFGKILTTLFGDSSLALNLLLSFNSSFLPAISDPTWRNWVGVWQVSDYLGVGEVSSVLHHCRFYLAQESKIFCNKLWPTFFFSHALFYQIYHEDTKSLGASRPDSLVVGRTVNESRGEIDKYHTFNHFMAHFPHLSNVWSSPANQLIKQKRIYLLSPSHKSQWIFRQRRQSYITSTIKHIALFVSFEIERQLQIILVDWILDKCTANHVELFAM